MTPVTLVARILIVAAACVLVLRCYAAFDSASLSDQFVSEGSSGVAGSIRATGIADAIRDAGILLASAALLLVLDRRAPG